MKNGKDGEMGKGEWILEATSVERNAMTNEKQSKEERWTDWAFNTG
jgi:hypothetical protein